MVGAFTVSSAMQDYLEVIMGLSEGAEAVRITDIAAKLNVAKASVTQAVNKLKELGLVAQEKYGAVELTRAGREVAAAVHHRHRALRKFLIEVLGVEPRIADKDACLMEHVVSPHTMEKLLQFLETARYPKAASPEAEKRLKNAVLCRDKFEEGFTKGKEAQEMRSIHTKALSELKPGESGKVLRVTAKNPVRRRILEMGVTPGTELSVKGTAPLGDPMELLVKGYHLSLRKEEASYVFVEVQQP